MQDLFKTSYTVNWGVDNLVNKYLNSISKSKSKFSSPRLSSIVSSQWSFAGAIWLLSPLSKHTSIYTRKYRKYIGSNNLIRAYILQVSVIKYIHRAKYFIIFLFLSDRDYIQYLEFISILTKGFTWWSVFETANYSSKVLSAGLVFRYPE